MDRIIYTRCSPWIDLNKDGQVIRSEGFGIAAISNELLSNTSPLNKRLLIKFVEERKSDSNCYDKLYEYAEIGNGKYVLNSVAELPLCTENRPNGSAHRPIFMAEALVGNFNNKPGLLLTKDNFFGDSKSQNDYYRLDYGTSEPFTLNQVREDELKITNCDSSFLTNERIPILEKILSFVIEQIKLPKNMQKPLFIKDTNENVINYIRFMSSCLTKKFAQKVTFLTHTSSYKNNPERYAYYVLKNDAISDYNAFAPELKDSRCLKWMIVGYTNGNLIKNQKSEFEVIDGKNSSYNPEVGLFVHEIASQNPCAINYLNYLEEKNNGELPNNVNELYKTYKSICSFNPNMSYNDALTFVDTFRNSIFYSDNYFLDRIIENISEYYIKHIELDYQNSFLLLDRISRMDIKCGNSLLSLILKNLYNGLGETSVSEKTVDMYEKLTNKGYIRENNLRDNILPLVAFDKLYKILNKGYAGRYIRIYLNLCFETLKYNNSEVSSSDPIGKTLSNLLKEYILKDSEIVNCIDVFLKRNNYFDVYEQAVKDAVKEGNEQKIEKLIHLYKPSLTVVQYEIEKSKYDTCSSFKKYEDEYIKKIKFNPNKAIDYCSVIIKLISSSESAKNDSRSGLQYANAIVDLLDNQRTNNILDSVCDYLLKLKEIKQVNDEELFNEIIQKLDEKLLINGLKNDIKPLPHKLSMLGVNSLKLVYGLKEDLENNKPNNHFRLFGIAKNNQIMKNNQLNALKSIRLNNISSELLKTHIMNDIIKSFDITDYQFHLCFIKAFAKEKELEDFIRKYFSIILSKLIEAKHNKIVLYYIISKLRVMISIDDIDKKIKEIIENSLSHNTPFISDMKLQKKYAKEILKSKNELRELYGKDVFDSKEFKLIEKDYLNYEKLFDNRGI